MKPSHARRPKRIRLQTDASAISGRPFPLTLKPGRSNNRFFPFFFHLSIKTQQRISHLERSFDQFWMEGGAPLLPQAEPLMEGLSLPHLGAESPPESKQDR